MKLKTIGLLVIAMNLIIGCAGEKNDTQVDDSMILAVRSLENAQNLPEDERTQVALLSGDISTPEKAQAAAENAEWMPLSQFEEDEELSFENPVGAQQVSQKRKKNRGKKGRRNNNRRRNKHWRPYRRYNHHWVNYGWVQPTYTYWGLNRCNHRYIYMSGRCVLPYSSYYGNYYWSPRYYYYTPIVYRGYRHRRNWRGRAHIRFYW